VRNIGTPSILKPKTGSVATSGEAHGNWNTEIGNQNAPRPPSYSTGKGYEVKDGFETGYHGPSASASGQAAGVNWSADVQGPTLAVDGSAKAKVSTHGIDVQADVAIDATLVQAGARAEKTIPVTLPGGEQIQVKVDLSAAGAVGAKGNLHVNVHLGTDGKVTAEVSADGFAGAKGSLTGAVSVTLGNEVIASGNATLSAYAGVAGAFDAHGSIGLHGVDFGATAAASAGAGFGVELNGKFDPLASAKLVGEVCKDVALGGLQSGVGAVGHAVDDAGHAIGDVAGHVGGAIGGLFN
jgi:hypothetical protein